MLAQYATNLRDACANEIQMVGRKKLEIMNMSQQKLGFTPDLIPELLKHNYASSAFWEKHSEKCLACGSCVLVCPTCYCFDMRDNPDLTLERGERVRTWDGCLRALPAGSTYKIRNGQYFFRGKRAFPSYLQAGPSFFIEKSRRKMIAEDIGAALALVNIAPYASCA